MLAIICANVPDTDDRGFMEQLYREYERLMFATARKYLSAPEDVEDVVHTSLLRIMKKIPDLRNFEPCILTAYIVSAVRNTSINLLRDQRRQQDHTAELNESIPSGALPMDELMELAERFRCKTGSVRMKLTRARRRALALLTREGKGARYE